MIKKFNIKDIVFLAIISTLLLIASAAIMPIVMFTNKFALRQVLASPIFAVFTVIALKKVSKLGSISIIGVFTGSFLLLMSPIMFFNNIVGGILTEIIVFIFFRNYNNDKAIIFGATIYMPMTVPISLLYAITMEGNSALEKMKDPTTTIIYTVLSIILGFIGAKLGMKIAKELQKAGKLQGNN